MQTTNRFSLTILGILLTLFDYGRHFFVVSEFRFCHNGPQRFKNKDCPYGVYLPKSVQASCAYYYNDQTGPGASAEIQSCKANPVSLTSTGEKVENVQIQAVFMEVTDPSSNGDLGTATDDCGTPCLASYKDTNSRGFSGDIGLNYDDEEAQYDYMVPYPGDEVISGHKNVTAELFLHLIEDDPPELKYLRSVQLLYKSFEILRQVCTPYIPVEFTEQVLKGFLYLLLKSNDTYYDVGLYEHKKIDEALGKCLKKPPPVQVVGMVCNNYTKIDGHKNTGKDSEYVKYKRGAKSFRWGLYDPFIDGTFAAMDFINGYCFEDMRADLNFHHIYQAAVEPLFTKSLMQRWTFPPVLNRGDGYWNNLLNVKDAKLMMWNLDACVHAGYANSIYKHRLNRPFVKFPQSLGQEAFAAAASAAAAVGAAVGGGGYKGTIDEYWNEYEAKDGFNMYLQSVGGACLKSEDEQNTRRNQLSDKCSV